MGSSKNNRSKKRARNRSSNGVFSDNFNTLFSLTQLEGMKPMVLKNLYRLFRCLSLNAQWIVKCSVGSHDFELEICDDEIKLTFGDISEFSDLLFKKLEGRFEQLFSNLRGVSANKDLGESSLNLGLFDDMEVVTLLFRCCLVILNLLAARQNLVLEKGLILLRIVRKLSSHDLVEKTVRRAFVFEKSVFRKNARGENGCSTSSVEGFTASLQFLGPSNPLLFFMSTMLELFVDELLAHEQLRGYFRMINSAASKYDMLFTPHSARDDIGIVIEVLCNHFMLSFSDQQVFGDFLSRLFCTHAMGLQYPFEAPALSVDAYVSLLLSPIMFSAPKYMQAHLISLTSEAIYSRNLRPDCKLTNCYLSTFEKSVSLYMTHMSRLETDGYSTFPKSFTSISCEITYPPFEFYVSRETKNKVDRLITKLDNYSNLNSNSICFRMKSDLVSSSMRFVKECLDVYAISSPDDILAVLSCLVLKASESYDDKAIRPSENTTLRHLYLLVSTLKLMAVSLIQAIRCLRYNGDSCCLKKTLKDFSSCKEYDFIMDIITCFGDLDISLPLQQDLANVMTSHSTRHSRSKMMFLHFSGLMSLSFESGLDCLVKACLLTLLAVLNLYIFEEGGLDAFQSLIDSHKKCVSSGLPIVRLQETVVDQNSSLVVASKFHKIRSLCSSVTQNKYNEEETRSLQALASASSLDMEAVVGLEEETEETSNGEIFLKCMLKTGENDISDADDLVDFVECKQGKDYSAWLKNRQKYRRWRGERLAVVRWKRKKKTWRTIKGKRN